MGLFIVTISLLAIIVLLFIIDPDWMLCVWPFFKWLGKQLNFVGFKPKTVNKQIIQYKNNKGDIYYQIKYNGELHELKFYDKEDAQFYYDNVIGNPKRYAIYVTLDDDCPYWRMQFDKCSIYYIPKYGDRHHYSKPWFKNHEFYADHNEQQYCYSLKEIYNKIVDTEFFEETVIVDNTHTEEINQKIKNAITNSDIAQLKEIIDEYKDTVEISNKITDTLLKL